MSRFGLRFLLSLLFSGVLFLSTAQAYDVAGTVSYSGGKSGRVYLVMNTTTGSIGTSIPGPGTFVIKGVPTGTWLITAFMDAQGNNSRHVSDPANDQLSLSSLVTVSTTSVTGVSVVLLDPAPLTTIAPPTGIQVFPGDQVALINWKSTDNGSGSMADSLSIYWDSSPTVTTSAPYKKLDMLANGDNNDLLLGGLTNGTYYFMMTAKSGSLTSAPSTVVGPITVGPPTGGYTVSGTVTFPAAANNKPLYIAVADKAGKMFPAYIPSAVSPQSFTVNGVTNGMYQVFAVIDANSNGLIDTGDYKANDFTSPIITVSGGNITTADVTIGSESSSAHIMTQHRKDGLGETYGLSYNIYDGVKKPVTVTLNSGPNIAGAPIDIGLSNWGGFNGYQGIGTIVPLVNDTYSFTVGYSDLTSETISGMVTGVVTALATPTAPVGSVTYSATPAFSWTAATNATPPANSSYELQLNEQNGMLHWDSNNMPLTQTSATFNFDSNASQASLTNGKTYNWGIAIVDPNRNFSANYTSFSFPGTGVFNPPGPTLTPATQGISYYQPLTVVSGGNGFYTWNIASGQLPPGLVLIPSTGEISGIPSTAGSYSFTLHVADNNTITPFSSNIAYSITVAAAPLSITTTSLSNATQYSAYDQTIQFTGGKAPYTWSIISGTLPSNMQFDASRHTVTGAPTSTGLYSFTVQVSDSSATMQTVSQPLSIDVMANPLSPPYMTTVMLPPATAGTAYNQAIIVAGGTPPYSYAFTSTTTPPAWLSLNPATGLLSGTPPTTGDFPFEIRVTDSTTSPAALTNTQTYHLVVQPPPVFPALSWGAVYHVTKSDGTQWDMLDIGIVNASSLATMTATVTGPNGFTYTFTDADKNPYLPSATAFLKQYDSTAPLASGVYTFTLNDGQGHVTARVDNHVAALPALPIVDSTTIQTQRKADGSYRVTWAPVNDTVTYYYRVRIQKTDGTPVYLGSRSMNGYEDIPLATLVDGTLYQVRVEVNDAPNIELVFNRSNSAFINFTPQAADYNANRLLLSWTNVYNRFEADGSQLYSLGYGFGNSTDPPKVTSAYVFGPNGFRYDFVMPVTGNQGDLMNGTDFFKSSNFVPTPPQPGLYTFHIFANGIEHIAYNSLTTAVAYALPDVTTYQAEDLGNGNIRFSWADVNNNGALYYRVQVQDSVTGQYINSSRLNQTFVDISKTALGSLTTKKWRVEVYDSSAAITSRNRINGAFTASPFPLQAYDATRPVINGYGITNDVNSNLSQTTRIWMNGNASGSTVTELRVNGPNGYSRNLLTQGKFDSSVSNYFIIEKTPLPSGLYTFTVTDSNGKSAVRHNYLTTPHPLPVVDFRTIKVTSDPNGDARISWAPVRSDIPLWYNFQLFENFDTGNKGWPDTINIPQSPITHQIGTIVTQSSVVIPAVYIGTWVSAIMRIQVMDGSNNTTYNNRSRSAYVGYQGTGFDYSTLTDADGDGYASNIDPNDNNPNSYPFSPPVISGSISYGGTKTGRIYITVQTGNGRLGTSINWPTEKNFTIRGVPSGSYTVNAFMDYLNLGTQVQMSPDGSAVTTLTTGDITGLNITLTDPAPIPPPAPTNLSASPGDASVLIGWDKSRNNGIESADAYDIYWGTTAAVSKTSFSGKRLNVPAGADSPAVIDGLTNGSVLYFVAVSKSGGIEGTASAVFGPITVGAPSGANTVSGTVNYSGVTPTGPLYVAVVNPMSKGAAGVYYTKIASPTASNPFTVTGVPDGSYIIYTIIDMNNDKLFANGDVTSSDSNSPNIVLTGNTGSSGNVISLASGNGRAFISTNHGKQINGTGEWFNIDADLSGELKKPVGVTLTSAPGSLQVKTPMDIGLGSDSGWSFHFWANSSVRPTVGDTYTFSVTYDDGTVDSAITAAVTGVSDSFPTNVSISSPTSTVPVFSWSAPLTPPSSYKYSIWVNNASYSNLWESWDIPSSFTSVFYGAIGQTAQPLILNNTYNYGVSVNDQNGNKASINSSFTPTNPTISITGTVRDSSSIAIPYASVSVYGADGVSNFGNFMADPSGYYVINNLPPGSYKLNITNPGYVSQWYNSRNSAAAADVVTVNAGITTANIDITLALAGSISGMVTDSGSLPLAGIQVTANLFDPVTGLASGYATVTDTSGIYTIPGLAPGTYKIRFSGLSYAPQWYDNQPVSTTSPPVTVTGGATTSGINAVMALGGSISGTVTDAGSLPLGGIQVTAYNSNNLSFGATTNATGNYTINGLAPGGYTVRFNTSANKTNNYITNWNYNQLSASTADSISVVAASTTNNVNATLPLGGSISGRLTDGTSGVPGINVNLYDAFDEQAATATTDANGDYIIQGVADGSYKLRFQERPNGSGTPSYVATGYEIQVYSNPNINAHYFSQGTPIVISSAYAVSGLNAVLAKNMGSISGTITAAGSPLSGAQARVFDLNGGYFGNALSDASGKYSIKGIPTDSYKVEFYKPGYNAQQWNINKGDFTSADTVSVTAPLDTPAISAALGTGPSIMLNTVRKGFGSIPVSSTTTKTFQINNVGTADLVMGAVSISGTAFALINDRCSGKTVSPSGYCTVQASFAPTANGAYSATINIPSNDPDSATLGIPLTGTGGLTQSISFTPLGTVTYGAAPLTLTATASSTLPVTYTIDSGPGSISGNILTISGAGAIKVRMSQPGDSTYGAAVDMVDTLTVTQASATITLSALTHTYNGTPKAVTALTTPLGIALGSTYNGSTTLPTAVGTYAVVATITDPNYSGSSSATMTIAAATQTITFGTAPALSIGGLPAAVSANASSGLPVIFSSLTPAVCTVSGVTVTPVTVGSCTVAANQAGDTNYLAAPQATQSAPVTAATATITLSGLAQIYDGTVRVVTAVTNPPGIAVSITYNGGATPPTAGGTYAVVATITDPNYSGSSSATMTIAAASQTITLGAPPALAFGGAPATVIATASSGLPIAFTSLTPAVCTVSSATVTATSAGTCTIAADQPGNGNYSAAAQATQTITVSTVTFTITATAGSNGAINPVGASTVNYGTSKTYTITPNSGYVVRELKVDGVPLDRDVVGSLKSYPFGNIVANHTIAAEFAPDGIIDPDTKGDGVITLKDILIALKIAMGERPATAAELDHADTAPLVDGVPHPDRTIDFRDVLVLLRRNVGLIKW